MGPVMRKKKKKKTAPRTSSAGGVEFCRDEKIVVVPERGQALRDYLL